MFWNPNIHQFDRSMYAPVNTRVPTAYTGNQREPYAYVLERTRC